MMKKDILFRMNVLICMIIITGFMITSIISYRSNMGIYEKDAEQVSALTSEGIYNQIDKIFITPVNVSQTMANDTLLKNFLAEEGRRLDDAAFLKDMREYLFAYREKYHYDSVFLVSAKTRRYYHFNGLGRVIQPGDPKDRWYYTLMDAKDEYRIDIDDDKASHHEVTVFINCKIKGPGGGVLGIVGVGFRVNSIQALLQKYEQEYGVKACLIDGDGMIAISANRTGYKAVSLFENCAYPELKTQILANKAGGEKFWYSSGWSKGYLATRYIPFLKWHLLVDNDMSVLSRRLLLQFCERMAVIGVIIAFVLFAITRVFRKCNAKIVALTVSLEKKRNAVFKEATEQLYEDIYELDITHNCAADESTRQYFESLGAPADVPYDQALEWIAEKQIKEEYRQGYIDTFSPRNVLQAYQNGIESLSYDFMITHDGVHFYWMRITARIFYWSEDHSVRMFTYRQNIDAEKRRQKALLEQMRRDSLSGLYNKAATQLLIQRALREEPSASFAFFILDIDHFKQVNDQYGHSIGDQVIAEFARVLRECFRENDIVGRIGGDEFAAFLRVPGREWTQKKARELVARLHRDFTAGDVTCKISASVGIALTPEAGTTFEALYKNADQALYHTKKNGKNGFTVYDAAAD